MAVSSDTGAIPLGPWVAALAAAEGAGIAGVAAAYAAVDRGLVDAVPAILAAGAWEGLCLGTAQVLFLARHGARPLAWLALTVIGAVAGYGLSLLGGAGAAAETAGPTVWTMALAAMAAGLGMGLILAALQLPALPRPDWRRAWLVGNALGWMPAMAVIMLAATSAGPGWPLGGVAALGAASGAVAGALVGLATGLALRRAPLGAAT